MNRKVFAVVGLVGLLASFTARADAAVFYIYRPVPVTVPVPITEPVVAFDADDRYAGAYDVQGVVTSFVPYHLTMRVHDREYPVLLHDGTIINPLGTTLAPSMIVNIAGWWDRFGVFHANRIDVLRF